MEWNDAYLTFLMKNDLIFATSLTLISDKSISFIFPWFYIFGPIFFKIFFWWWQLSFFFLTPLKANKVGGYFSNITTWKRDCRRVYYTSTRQASLPLLFFFSMDKMGVKKMNTIRWRQCQKSQTFLPNISKKEITHWSRFCWKYGTCKFITYF